mmetsp:Transcript_12720/g.39527  ORF Transcript_12720/g.39527 Transcript_12720/m.39527 type:complete len:393 (+) Transcript_12720:1683-2861(+)
MPQLDALVELERVERHLALAAQVGERLRPRGRRVGRAAAGGKRWSAHRATHGIGCVHEYLVVEPQLALGHARQEGAHLERAAHLRAHHRAVGVDQQVDALHHVKEDLVLLVGDALLAPRDGVGHRHGRLDVALLGGVRIGLDVLGQNLALRILRVAEVHHFVQQLVHDDEVVAQYLLVQLVEVLLEDAAQPVQEEQDRRRVYIGGGARHHVQVVVLHVRVRDTVVEEHRPQLRFRLCLVQPRDELVRTAQRHVAAVVTAQQHAPLCVQEEEGTDGTAARGLGRRGRRGRRRRGRKPAEAPDRCLAQWRSGRAVSAPCRRGSRAGVPTVGRRGTVRWRRRERAAVGHAGRRHRRSPRHGRGRRCRRRCRRRRGRRQLLLFLRLLLDDLQVLDV